MVQLFSNGKGRLSAAILIIAEVILAGGAQRCAAQSEPLSPAPLTSVEPGAVPQDLSPLPNQDATADFAVRDDQLQLPEPTRPELLGADQPLPSEIPDLGTSESEESAALPQRVGDVAGSTVPDDHPFADLFLDLPPEMLSDEAFESEPLESEPLAGDPTTGALAEQPLSPDELERVMAPAPAIEQVARPPQSSPLFPALPGERGYAVLLAAPVHEALIHRWEVPLQAAPVVSVVSPPPPELNEQPPLPSRDVPVFVGNEVQWISGYWAWLADADKYVWISGLYRDVPPGRRWQPGQWTQTSAGYRWDSGYWAEANQAQGGTANRRARRASAPPLVQDATPQSPAPHRDSFWISGVWQVEDGASEQLTSAGPTVANATEGYRWQKGFWATRSAQWIWQPAHYVRAGDDFVFVSGYWDYEPHFRGQAYAAVDFSNSTLAAEAIYRPAYPLCRPISTLLHLFFKSDNRTVFYGDLYDVSYAALGYRPWYQTGGPTGSSTSSSAVSSLPEDDSPLLSFYNWKYQARGIDFIGSMLRFERHFRSAPSIRPATQLTATPRLVNRDGLAGAVYADSFDAIVRGVVAGQPAVRLADVQPVIATNRSAAKPVVTADTRATSSQPVSDSPAVIAAAALQQPLNATPPPQDAVPLGLPGTSGLMVLPGGKIISAPPTLSPAPAITPAIAPIVGDADANQNDSDLDLLFGRP